jgi:hypothetical protein
MILTRPVHSDLLVTTQLTIKSFFTQIQKDILVGTNYIFQTKLIFYSYKRYSNKYLFAGNLRIKRRSVHSRDDWMKTILILSALK